MMKYNTVMTVLLWFLPPANEVWGTVIFLHQFVILLTGGACVVAPGGDVHGIIRGGMSGFIWGACMVLFGGPCMVLFRGCMVLFGGHAWFYSGGHAWFFQGGVHGFSSFFGYNEIRSMSRRYASYWNAFLLHLHSKSSVRTEGKFAF